MMKTLSQGFSFLEVIFAIALLGAIGAPILMLNYNVLISTDRTSELSERIIVLERTLQEQLLEQATKPKEGRDAETKKNIKIDEPPTEIVYERNRIPEQSQLAVFKEAQLVKVTGSWQLNTGGSRTESLVTFAVKPIETKK